MIPCSRNGTKTGALMSIKRSGNFRAALLPTVNSNSAHLKSLKALPAQLNLQLCNW